MSESFLSRWARLKRRERGERGERGGPAERSARNGSDDASPGAGAAAGAATGDASAQRDLPERVGPAGGDAPTPEAATGDANATPRGAGALPAGAAPAGAAPAAASSDSADDRQRAESVQHPSGETAPIAGVREAGPAERSREAELPLPPLESLTPQSDFRPFLRAGVAPQMRNAALKKLFADPHFNVMDGLDVYIEDYNLTTPIAENTMRRLVQARTLRLFDDVEQAEPGPGDSDPASLAASTASPTTPAEAGLPAAAGPPAKAGPSHDAVNPRDPGIPAVASAVPADPNDVSSDPSCVPADANGASRLGSGASESGPDEAGNADSPRRSGRA